MKSVSPYSVGGHRCVSPLKDRNTVASPGTSAAEGEVETPLDGSGERKAWKERVGGEENMDM